MKNGQVGFTIVKLRIPDINIYPPEGFRPWLNTSWKMDIDIRDQFGHERIINQYITDKALKNSESVHY